MDIKLFNYNLPKKLIAQKPSEKRENSKLMVLANDKIYHKRFHDIIDYLRKGDVLVINESKVLKAKLTGKKDTGGKVEVIVVKKIKDYYETRIKGKKIRLNTKLIFNGIEATVIGIKKGVFYIRFNKKLNLEKYGELPLPFYVHEKQKYPNRYQTVYSKKSGSLAAPTAGLHFSEQLMNKIQKKGVKIAKICLHIDFGTFLPIKEKDILKHKMHKEFFEITKKNADIINNAKRIIAVGTTSLRALESAACNGKIKPMKRYTTKYIYPGYKFKSNVNALITNFHLPKSSLLILVCGFYTRKKILNAYEEAIKHNYRFYSLGDAMILLKENSQPQ